MFTTRAGIFNVALEGLMLIGSFAAVAGTYWTGAPYLGLALAVLTSTLFALLFGLFSIDVKANGVIVGLAINIFALGVTTFAMLPVFGVTGGGFYNADLAGLPNLSAHHRRHPGPRHRALPPFNPGICLLALGIPDPSAAVSPSHRVANAAVAGQMP